MTGTIAIVDMTCRSAVGLEPGPTAAAVRAGIMRVQDHPFMVDPVGEPVRGAFEPTLPSDAHGTERLVMLTRLALRPLVERASAWHRSTAPLPVLLGLPERRPGFSESDEAAVLAAASAAAPGFAVRTAAYGHAAVLHAFVLASELLADRTVPFVIIGGVDSYFHGATVDWLIGHRQLQAGDTRSGFFPGEAASFLALMSADTRRDLGLPALASLRGSHSAWEEARIKTDAVNRARALTAAVRGAAANLGPDERCDRILCDINGERYRTDEWSTTLLRIPGLLHHEGDRPADYEAPSRSWGDVGAASGALFCALVIADRRRLHPSGGRTLLFAGSEHGLRAAVILQSTSE